MKDNESQKITTREQEMITNVGKMLPVYIISQKHRKDNKIEWNGMYLVTGDETKSNNKIFWNHYMNSIRSAATTLW